MPRWAKFAKKWPEISSENGGGGGGGCTHRQIFSGCVRLQFSIGYPWLRKFWSKTYHWEFSDHGPIFTCLKKFQPKCSLLKRKFPKTDANLAPKCQCLGVFVIKTPLAKEFLPKIHPKLKNLGSKSDPWEWHTTSKVLITSILITAWLVDILVLTSRGHFINARKLFLALQLVSGVRGITQVSGPHLWNP